MSEAEKDYFTDHSVLVDPYGYFEDMRGKCPVHQMESRDIMMVTGFQETLSILNNPDDFSSAIAPGGPVVDLPFAPEGGDISAQIEAHRGEIALSDLLVALDDQPHRFARSIMNKLFVPSRLKANEAYIEQLADTMVRDVVARGGCELINDVATPFVTLVIADLLGVPEEDREQFRSVIDANAPPGNMDADGGATTTANPLEFMAGFFFRYLMERRAAPGEDVLTELAQARYPDDSEPEIVELVKMAAFLFGAGQDTSAKLLGNCMRFLVDDPELQQTLRNDRSLIPAFIEEVLRLEGSSKVTFRLARRDTMVGDTLIPAGKRIVLALAAANRDPARWEDPAAFRFDRPKVREHLAFGRGAHVCSGAPLARVEIRIILNSLLDHTAHIALDGDKHGADPETRLRYDPSFIVRGLSSMHLTFTRSSQN
jgi:cytochrome P450